MFAEPCTMHCQKYGVRLTPFGVVVRIVLTPGVVVRIVQNDTPRVPHKGTGLALLGCCIRVVSSPDPTRAERVW